MTGAETTRYALDNGAAWITLDRPQARNALSAQLVSELHGHVLAAAADPAVRCIVLTGAGSAFCAGADLKNPPGGGGDGDRAVSMPELLTAMMECDKPVIAAVNGSAFAGGLGLVGAADIVITVDDAQFSFSEVRIGVIPAVIAVVCVPKLGRHQAMKLFVTGERFSGVEAVDYGLAHSAVPADRLRAAVDDVIALIALGGPNAVRECKKLVRQVGALGLADDFAAMSAWSLRMFRSEEAAEGMAASRDKRPPAWRAD